MDCFDLLAIQGTPKNLLQHHSSKASVLQCSVFFMVQLSHPYMTTEKTIALTVWTFAGKVRSLLFNILSKLVIAFLPRSKQVSFNFMVAVTICSDFGAQENKVSHYFHCYPIYLPWSDGTGHHAWSSFCECWVLSQLFHLSPLSRSSLFPLHFLPQGWCHLHIWDYWYFSQQFDFSMCFFYTLLILHRSTVD